MQPGFACQITVACMSLHNIARRQRDDLEDSWDVVPLVGEERIHAEIEGNGNVVRDEIARTIFS